MPSSLSRPLAAAAALALLSACGGSSAPPAPACSSAAQCDDGNACTVDTCAGGGCGHAPAPADAPCSAGGGQVCDGAGACVACNRDAQCAGTGPHTLCQHPACTAHACAPAFEPAGTTTATGQVAGDCQRIECDGAGATRTVSDDGDVPDDLKECTTDACAGGTPAHAPLPAGTACGSGAYSCTANGDCGCQGDLDCTPPATCGGGGTALVCGCTPGSCGGLARTCGSPPDGCGGTLSCDGAKDANETDVDCGGDAAACATRCAQGKACLAGTDCATGFCADGVCCDTACDGGCVACTAARKGAGQDGVCGAVAGGTDPDAECAASGHLVCGLPGSCDGAGACSGYPNGTACASASCTGATFTAPATCDGAGACLGASGACPGNLVCEPGGAACKLACAGDADCVPGFYCTPANACAPKLAQGAACASASSCASGFCVDGTCCNAACGGTCQACSAALTGQASGACAPVLAGTDPGNECPSGGICGVPGVCNGAGACNANVAPSTTVCAAQSCTAGTLTPVRRCDGTGTCPPAAPQSCGGYVCGLDACKVVCLTDADCVATHYCGAAGCLARKAAGDLCTADRECVSGVCLSSLCQ